MSRSAHRSHHALGATSGSPHRATKAGAALFGVLCLVVSPATAPCATAVAAHRWSDAQHMDHAALSELSAFLLAHPPEHVGPTLPLPTAYPVTRC
jgi:hypothetical protein